MPSQARPPDSTSSVVTIFARTPGCRYTAPVTRVSSLARDVQAGQVAERGVGLEHLALGRPDPADLEEVVHHRDELEAALVGGAGHGGQVRAEPRRAVRRGEVGDLQANLHGLTPSQRRPVALVQGLQRPQERLAVGGRQRGEHLLLAGPDRGLHGSPQPVARRGQREQVHPPVGGVRLALDQPALLQVIQHADDAALVRVDGLRERRLRPHRLLDQRGQHDVTPHRDVVRLQGRLLARDQRPGQGREHRRQVTSVVRERAHRGRGVEPPAF